MLKRLAIKISQVCIQNGLPKEKLEIYVYGLECIIIEIVGNLLLFTLAGIFGFFWHSVFWTIGLCSIRFYAGGYHAKTFARCLFLSTVNGFLF